MPKNWRASLDQIIQELKDNHTNREYDLNLIIRRVRPPTIDELATELTERIQQGEITATYRILSPETRSGIAEYKNFLDIPSEVYDETTDHMLNVVPSRDIEIVYRALRT